MIETQLVTKGRLLKGIKDICNFFDITPRDFYMFKAMNWPVIQINERYFAWSVNLEQWFMKKTSFKPATDVTDEEIDRLQEEDNAKSLSFDHKKNAQIHKAQVKTNRKNK